MSLRSVALYARVSSDQQTQAQTIASQLAALRGRIEKDGGILSPEHEFIDDGYSGSTLIRPALERLRDAVAAGEIERVYAYVPDRLARKYAHQVLLIEEFQRAGVEWVFLNREFGQSPEDQLLLQMQGVIAEYERAQIIERSRRGKRHKAQQGSVGVLGGAPYGYRYITIAEGGGEARYEIVEEQARVVRQMFDWLGRERVSLGEVQRRLAAAGIPPVQGKTPWWERSVIWTMVTNPAYKGQARFGKTRAGELRARLREQRGRPLQPRRARTMYKVPPEQQLPIAVPALVSEERFEAVQLQLEENRRRAREGQRGANYLLQGLLVCACCGYSYYGKPISAGAGKGRTRYAYYRCIGSDAYRFGGQRLCDNKAVRTDQLDPVVWQEVCQLLEDPQRLADEYQRRLDAVQAPSSEGDAVMVEKQIAKVRQGITRLIDGYAEGYLDKAEAEPRIRRFKERLQTLEQQAEQLRAQAQQQTDLQLIIGRLEEFSVKVKNGLEQLDWHGCRELIRTLVKRVEIDQERVNVVFRVDERTFPGGNDPFLQHCKRRGGAYSRICQLQEYAEYAVIGWQ